MDGLVISIDAMGGDFAPDIVIKGLEYFLKHEGKGRRRAFPAAWGSGTAGPSARQSAAHARTLRSRSHGQSRLHGRQALSGFAAR